MSRDRGKLDAHHEGEGGRERKRRVAMWQWREGGGQGRGKRGAMTARTIIEMDRQRRRRMKGNKESGWQKYGRQSRKGGGVREIICGVVIITSSFLIIVSWVDFFLS